MTTNPPAIELETLAQAQALLQPVTDELDGVYPTAREIHEHDPRLLREIMRLGGLRRLRTMSRIQRAKKPNGYYQDFENVRREAEEAAEILGHFPSKSELDLLDMGSLSTSIQSLHGGIAAVREKMDVGERTDRRPDGYWRDAENVRAAMLEAIEKNDGSFPGHSELRALGMSALATAVDDHHGGILKVRKKMGHAPADARPPGYWHNLLNVQRELAPVIREIGGFPRWQDLLDRGLTGLLDAVKTHWGGMGGLRARMGYERNASVKEFETHASELAQAYIRRAREEDTFEAWADRIRELLPTEEALHEYLNGDAIKMRRRNGYWRNWYNTAAALLRVWDETGEFPTQQSLNDGGLGSLAVSIASYHGGLPEARKRLGAPPGSEMPRGYWQEWKNVEAAIRAVEAVEGRFTTDLLCKHGFYAAVPSIRENFGGMRKVRERLGAVQVYSVEPGHWNSWENVAHRVREIYEERGEFPSSIVLAQMNEGGLADAIMKKHGGYRKVRERLGIAPQDVKPDGYWHEWENIEAEILEAIEQLGRFPTAKCLKNSGRSSLSQAISKYFGGFNKVRERMGWRKLKEELMREYAPQIMGTYIQRARTQDTFEAFVASILDRCRTERDLLNFLQDT